MKPLATQLRGATEAKDKAVRKLDALEKETAALSEQLKAKQAEVVEAKATVERLREEVAALA